MLTLEVNGIPMLVIVDPSGELITADGREAIAMDPEGKNFPWKLVGISRKAQCMFRTLLFAIGNFRV